jgi:ABC-type multidrug transport system ATPase subunit
MRFYELDKGRICLDGIDISTVPREEVRAKIGMVLQDTWLFAGTIRDNLRYGKLDATDNEIKQAAEATYVDRFVKHLPKGYDTEIDDEGTNVSAGEKQLLTIARAFLVDPAILILDEATSSVDTRTEVLVQRAMAALRAGRTSFVIAHRLSTIRDADLILVMENGAIVEQGTHAELLAKRALQRAVHDDVIFRHAGRAVARAYHAATFGHAAWSSPTCGPSSAASASAMSATLKSAATHVRPSSRRSSAASHGLASSTRIGNCAGSCGSPTSGLTYLRRHGFCSAGPKWQLWKCSHCITSARPRSSRGISRPSP